MANSLDELLNPNKEVEPIRRLMKFYADGIRLIEDIYRNIDVENFDRQKILDEVTKITDSLEVGTKQWIEESFPEMYTDAAIVSQKLIKAKN